jgi:uncharacterized protein (TIGR03083 family)
MIELMFAFDPLVVIDEASTRAAAAAADDSTAAVPSCPGWTVRDVVQHLGYVFRFWTDAISLGGAEPAEQDEGVRPADIVTWATDSSAALVAAARATSSEAPAWTWWGEPATVGAIVRHQVQEALVHAWDADLALCSRGRARPALDRARPLEPAVADDGVAEFLAIMLGEVAAAKLPAQVALAATDTGSIWHAGPGDPGEPAATVRGTASDLVLLLYRRIGLDAVEVEGDPVAAVALVAAAETE